MLGDSCYTPHARRGSKIRQKKDRQSSYYRKSEPCSELAFFRKLVRMRGLEPPRCRHHRLLRPARLPVPPHPHAGKSLCECVWRVSRKGNARVVIDSICEERWRKSITERNAFSPASSPHSAGLRGRVVVSYERATCSCRFTFDGYGERPGISWRSILTRPDKASLSSRPTLFRFTGAIGFVDSARRVGCCCSSSDFERGCAIRHCQRDPHVVHVCPTVRFGRHDNLQISRTCDYSLTTPNYRDCHVPDSVRDPSPGT